MRVRFGGLKLAECPSRCPIGAKLGLGFLGAGNALKGGGNLRPMALGFRNSPPGAGRCDRIRMARLATVLRRRALDSIGRRHATVGTFAAGPKIVAARRNAVVLCDQRLFRRADVSPGPRAAKRLDAEIFGAVLGNSPGHRHPSTATSRLVKMLVPARAQTARRDADVDLAVDQAAYEIGLKH